MSSLDQDTAETAPSQSARAAPARLATSSRTRILPYLITILTVAAAALLGWQAWRAYMGTPWTRDGTVRAYVVKIAPQVAGQIVKLPVADNQFVHKGELLMLIDPTSYAIAVEQAEAEVDQAKAVADNARAESTRRQELNDLAVTVEERQTYASRSLSAQAQYQLAVASLQNARVNLQRTQILSPVNGYVTNLQARTGDYANVGQLQVSVIDADSYWVDGYFEETFLETIHEGDAASVKLMGYRRILKGHVQSIARGINVSNATPDASGLASVNPIFAFVRLAQRVPVRIRLEDVPGEVRLVAGMTATVEIEPGRTAASPLPSGPNAAASQAVVADSPPAPAAGKDAASSASTPAPDRTQAIGESPAQAKSTVAESASATATADMAPTTSGRSPDAPTVDSSPGAPANSSASLAPAPEMDGKTRERAADENAARPERLSRAEGLDERLLGAWAPSASDCREVFDSEAGKLTFRRPVNTFISAFIVGEREIHGVNGSCRIGRVSSMGGYFRIKLECSDAIGFLPIDARIKILSDTRISYGDVSNDPSIDAMYERCSR
ncbi:MAG TPA: efflux RND transporter periplasmic adaptor subunit [Roseiarcus sp.]|nr:efflux RND transporter periplasmic adaptor subunit [Roseiarcus sp.]